MATTSTQQTNGANTLIVSSSLIPLSSSSVNSPTLASSQPSLIAAQNQLAQQQPFLQVFPHDTFQLQQLYQQQMFLQPQASLTLQQQNSIQNANEQLVAAKKKANKQQKIVSKTSNQLQQPVLKSNLLTGQPQFTHQNNQAVVISQLPNVLSNSQQAIANKKLLDSQKNKQIVSIGHLKMVLFLMTNLVLLLFINAVDSE